MILADSTEFRLSRSLAEPLVLANPRAGRARELDRLRASNALTGADLVLAALRDHAAR